MTYFTTLPQMAHYIKRHHSLFALCPAYMALDSLAQIKATLARNKAVEAVTVEALQHIPDHGYLKTYCTIGRDKRGAWYLHESTKAPE